MSPRSAGPPESPIHIFVDRNLASGVLLRELREAQITHDLGLEFRSHMEEFPEFDTVGELSDAQWLGEIGQRGWLILSRDLRIRYNQAEKQAIKDSRASFFAITAKNVSSRELAQIILKAMKRIVGFARHHDPPFIALVYRDGKIKAVDL
ncbi:MAG: hypothetical protein OYM47_08330 [Gemmatimonadota bacterium]|nr:hypothetical protein [Gemmatimonadota bacterium]